MTVGLRRCAVALIGLAMGMAATTPASAQLFWKTPNFSGGPVTGSEADVLIPLPGATAAEMNAEVVWTLRAGLNFAALQCQFAPSLMTVNNYNQLLGHHTKELATNYKLLQGYFKRTAKKGATANQINAALDNFNTRTYSSFSSVFAQVGFCQTASRIGGEALMQPKGTLEVMAHTRLRELRNSLKPAADGIYVGVPQIQFASSEGPVLAPDCFDRKGEIKKKCL
ncbi:MAG TPA: hypothetical protein VKQ09_00940 [Sphingomonas sp.]|nr:hypothetical protein [Sphingomonas sp.]